MNTSKWDEKIRAVMEEYHLNGVALAVTDRERTIYSRGYGYLSADSPEMQVSPDALFRIASVTKLTVGLLCMKFCEEGILDLDAPFTQYVPWVTQQDIPTAPRITLRRLLSHSAGLPSEFTPDGPHDEDRLEDVLRAAFPKLVPIADPDDRLYYYCNWGIRMISYILQQVGGMPFTALVKRYILEPLGMTRSTFTLCEAATWPLALPHCVNRNGEPEVVHFIPVNATRHAAGGLFSTANDLAKLARVLLNNGYPLVSAASLEMMKTPQCNLYLGHRNEYGLTMRLKEYRGLSLCGHDGQSPPYFSSLWTCPEKEIGIVVLTSTETGEPATDIIPKFILSDLFDLQEKSETVAVTKSDIQLVKAQEGLYLSDFYGLIQLKAEDDHPVLYIQNHSYPLTKHERPGVYYFSMGDTRMYVGLPGTDGGSSNHLLLNAYLCGKVQLSADSPPVSLDKYTGEYGTVLCRYSITSQNGVLYVQNGSQAVRYPCTYVSGEIFSCSLGAVIFVRSNGELSGVRVGSSTVHNRLLI